MLVTVLLLLLLLFKQCNVTHHKYHFVLLMRPRYIPWYSLICVFIDHGTYSKNYVITTIHVHIIMSKNHSNAFFLYA